MSTLRLRGGRVDRSGQRHRRTSARPLRARRPHRRRSTPRRAPVDEIDASGCVVMAGGIDMHTHIGGGKVNLARLLMPEDHRADGNPIALPGNPLELASCGGCAPGTLATGYRYVEMGYTAAFEPAMIARNARQAHMEMGDTPILDHGAYVMLGNDELFLNCLLKAAKRHATSRRIRDYVGWTMQRHQGDGREGGQPGRHLGLQVQPAQARCRRAPRALAGHAAPGGAHAGARAARTRRAASAAHPRQQPGRGRATSNRRSRPSMRWKACPAHLTHVQFHAYGTEGPKKFSSAALQLAEAVNANPNISIDVGQIMFGQTVTASGDTMRQHAQSGPRQPAQVGRRATSSARPAAASCRSATASRATSTRCSGSIGLETLPAGERPVARGADHRPSERRARSPAIRT